MITVSQHELMFGSLDLAGPATGTVAAGAYVMFATSETTWGAADPVTSVVASLLADGDHVSYDRDGNRQLSIQVHIRASDHLGLARGEAALDGECRRRNMVTWVPPDGVAPTTVFEVVTSYAVLTSDDLAELHYTRTFDVTLTCLPHARSADVRTVTANPAPPASPTTSTISDGSTTTRWSGAVDGVASTPIQGSGFVYVNTTPPNAGQARRTVALTYTPASAFNFSTQKYVAVDAKVAENAPRGVGYPAPMPGRAPEVRPTGQEPLPLVSTTLMPSGFYRHVYDASDRASVPAMQILVDMVKPAANGYLVATPDPYYFQLWVDSIQQSTAPFSVSTARQVTRVIPVEGTRRTPGSLHVANAGGTGLLETFVHTCPEDGSGYSPPLRRWRTAGGTVTVDANTFSGGREPLDGFVAEVPTASLPEGGYLLMASMRCTSATTASIAWSTSTLFPGETTQRGFSNGTTLCKFDFADSWQSFPLWVRSLPSVRTSSGKVQVVIQSLTAGVTLDEAWLFRADEGCALTWLATTRKHLWLDSPDLTRPQPTVWVGDNADRSLTHHPGEFLKAMGDHVFTPGQVAVFTATMSNNPLMDLSYYPRWNTNAAA